MPRRELILFTVLASVWGASYLFIKVALEDVSPGMVVFVRTALAALVLLPFALRANGFAGLRGAPWPLTILALLQVAAPFTLISAGEEHLSSSLAGILVATAPIFTFLLAIRLDEAERVRGIGLLGVFLGLAGVALLLGIDAGGGQGALVGGLMVVLASLGYALGAFYLKRRFAAAPPLALATGTLAVSALVSLPYAAATFPHEVPGPQALVALTALGALGTGLAFVIYYTLIGRVGPGRASLVAYVAPGFAVVYGVVLLGESFGLATLAGLIMIVGGSWLAAEGRLPWQPRRHRPSRSPAAVTETA